MHYEDEIIRWYPFIGFTLVARVEKSDTFSMQIILLKRTLKSHEKSPLIECYSASIFKRGTVLFEKKILHKFF